MQLAHSHIGHSRTWFNLLGIANSLDQVVGRVGEVSGNEATRGPIS